MTANKPNVRATRRVAPTEDDMTQKTTRKTNSAGKGDQPVAPTPPLPEGWEWVTIGDTLQIVRGISFPKDAKTYEPQPGLIACLRTANVQQKVDWQNLWFVPEEFVKRDEQFIQRQDILISTANSLELVGKVALVENLPVKATLGAFISLIRVPSPINQKFVYYQLSSFDVQRRIRKLASTTTNISNISTTKLKTVSIALAPRPEQERIVAKIEALFSHLEAAQTMLARTQRNLKRYRASVLKTAVEGRLVSRRRGGFETRPNPDAPDAQGESGGQLLQRILAERRARWEAEE
ncbi:MAG: hypothetical protein D6816_05985, partial [Bacteroidetes bacterium]